MKGIDYFLIFMVVLINCAVLLRFFPNKDYGVRVQFIVFLIVVICLLYFLIAVVIPNMSEKSVPISWMTMLGSTIIFGYSIFYELKDTSLVDCFSSEVVFSRDYERNAFKKTPYNIPNSDTVKFFSNGLINKKTSLESGYDDPILYASDLGKELILLSSTCFLSRGRDWRTVNITLPSGMNREVLLDEESMAVSQIFETDCLVKGNFKILNISPSIQSEERVFGYSNFPEGKKYKSTNDSILFYNKFYEYEIFVKNIGQAGEWSKDAGIPLEERRCSIPYMVVQKFTIKGGFSGHDLIPRYENFRNVIMNDFNRTFIVVHKNDADYSMFNLMNG